jgi:hypothetical protein
MNDVLRPGTVGRDENPCVLARSKRINRRDGRASRVAVFINWCAKSNFLASQAGMADCADCVPIYSSMKQD